ncbi:hypothetical protein [Tsukamurella ocularis]|uniref:hypothetical protein n=1 Tax=Tsukamurella ocularis TaxID=1970234 RepID=UPI00216A91A2|nr:hypothetical protein [Tsukamurella ocularis]MCS3853344.1 hypothetical protein [Tsukamurella ocularis]
MGPHDELYIPTWLKAQQNLLDSLPRRERGEVVGQLHARWLDGEDFKASVVADIVGQVSAGWSPGAAIARVSAARDGDRRTYSAP